MSNHYTCIFATTEAHRLRAARWVGGSAMCKPCFHARYPDLMWLGPVDTFDVTTRPLSPGPGSLVQTALFCLESGVTARQACWPMSINWGHSPLQAWLWEAWVSEMITWPEAPWNRRPYVRQRNV
jgi:hypothetical protein